MSIPSIAAILFIAGSLAYFYKRGSMTAGLIITNVVMYVASLIIPVRQLFDELVFSPAYLLPQHLPAHFYTIFTSMFLHSIGDPLHIIMNMLVLFIVGIELERRIGSANFLATYLVSGIVAGVFWGIINLAINPMVFAVGASGAIFGILGTLGWLYPRERITMFLGFFIVPNVPALFAVVLMGMLEVLYAAIGSGNVAHLAHVGGIFGGFAMSVLIKPRRFSGAGHREPRIGNREQGAGSRESPIGALRIKPGRGGTLSELYEGADADGKLILAKAIDESIMDVRSAWLSEFAAKKPCPKCGGKLEEIEGTLRCVNGHEWQ